MAWLAFVTTTACAQASRPFMRQQLDGPLFDVVWEVTRDHFYDAGMHGVDWDAVRAEFAPLVSQATALSRRARLINEMLTRLNASHTELLTPDEPRYYHLLDAIGVGAGRRGRASDAPDSVSYAGIGVFLTRVDRRQFVAAVWPGFPADQAGLRMGDEIVSAGGKPFAPVASFRGRPGEPVPLMVRSSRRVYVSEVTVVPVEIRPREAFLQAQKNSCRVETRGDVSVGYIHILSYAGPEYQQALVEAATVGPLRECDALLIDLREGLGGAQMGCLSFFLCDVPKLEVVSRDGTMLPWRDGIWRKPVALLVNERTYSGKECIAHSFQRLGIGKVIGTRTAGAVLAGRLFRMPEDCLLYLAVSDIRVDGQRLEGVGVTPDIVVPFDLRYCGGTDPQFERGVEVLAAEVRAERSPKVDREPQH